MCFSMHGTSREAMVEFGENGYFHGTVLPSASELKVKVSSDGK